MNSEISNSIPIPKEDAPKKTRARSQGKAKPPSPVGSLIEALKFVGMGQKKIGTIGQQFCMLSAHWAASYNEILTIAHRIEEDLNCCPNTTNFLEALTLCENEVSITLLSENLLSVQSDNLKALIECASFDEIFIPNPDEQCAAIDDRIKEAFKALNCLISDSTEHAFKSSVLLQSNTCVATNGAAILEYWHGIDLPPGLLIPKAAVSAISKSKKELSGFGFSNSTATFYFKDDSFIKTQLFSERFPQYINVLEDEKTNPWPVDPNFFKALKSIFPFTREGKVILSKDTIYSHDNESQSSTYKTAGLPDKMGFDAEQLLNLEHAITHVYYSKAQPKLYFFGNNVRGALMGIKIKEAAEINQYNETYENNQLKPINSIDTWEDDIPFYSTAKMLDDNGFIVKNIVLKQAVRSALKTVVYMTSEELEKIPSGSIFVFDVECYRNFFYVAFKCLMNGKYVAFERSPACDFNPLKLSFMLWRFCLVGFNSNSYDLPMVELAIKGLNCTELKEASDYIIKSGINWGTKKITQFDVEKKYKIKIGKYNHIDLFQVCPVNGGLTANPASLKLYSGRLHCKRMQDLPYDSEHILTEDEAPVVRLYNCNDLDNTQLLFESLASEIKLRVEMSEEYGVDLRSKSDAQIAEAVVNAKLTKLTGRIPIKAPQKFDSAIKYNIPDFLTYKSPHLRDMLELVRLAEFALDALGSPIVPKSLEGHIVTIGKTAYKIGAGGLHSQEKSVTHLADENTILLDIDAESFYPRTILNQRLFPAHLGEAFLHIYEAIVTRRIVAKKGKNKKVADSLKIVINGLFGKFGNKYSIVYSPQLMLQVTLTGQLVLLMLVEMLEEIGISVVSGNTDGVILKFDKSRFNEVDAIVKQWEAKTGYSMEHTRYAGIYNRDVNNYIATKLKFDEIKKVWTDEIEECKVKGAYSERGSALNSILSKNPEALIVSDAIKEFIINKTPMEQTIKNCNDFRRFVSVRNVKGGGQKDGYYLGKVVRWYYAAGEKGYISYMGSGNKVAKTDGAKPVMDLPDEFPTDINYKWYLKEANDALYDIGFYQVPKTASLF